MNERHGDDSQSLGRRIAAARARGRISQAELARRLGSPLHRLDQLELGEVLCTPALLLRIAEALGVPFRNLRGEAPTPEISP